MKKVLVACCGAVLVMMTFFSAALAETQTIRIYGQLWSIDLAKACQNKQVIFKLGGADAAMKKKGAVLLINGSDSGVLCPAKVVKKRRGGGGGGGSTYVSNLEVAVHPDGSPVLNPGEVHVPVGNTNIGNTPVTGIGGTGEYTPVNDQPAPAPDVEPVDTTRPEEVSAGFGPVNN